jgi:hypothetical protein
VVYTLLLWSSRLPQSVSDPCDVLSASLDLNRYIVSRKTLKGSNLPLLGVILLLYVMAIIHLGNHTSYLRNAFINHANTSEDTILFLFAPNNLSILSDIVIVGMPVLADCILVSNIFVYIYLSFNSSFMSFIDMESLCYLGWQLVSRNSSRSFNPRRTV